VLARELNKTDHHALEQEIDRLTNSSAKPFSILLVDVGDTGKFFVKSGLAASRKVLVEVAQSLQGFCRRQDRLCRIADDIFCLILPGVHRDGHTALAAEKIVRLHSDAIQHFDATLRSKVRIGIATFPQDGDDAADLIHKARIALESARITGKNYVSFTPALALGMINRWDLQEDLIEAIEEKTMELFYQPKFDIATRRPIGAEALLRWSSPKHGKVSPAIFIPLAAEMGLMQELTGFVFTTGLRQAAEWPNIGEPLELSANLEATSLQHEETFDMVVKALSIWGNKNCKLTIEITEGALVCDSDSNFERLKQLRSAGVGISIDDFGTGYSSLSYFRNIPATELKIDRSFVSNMLESERDRRLVEAIIWLAHQFGLKVVAEGAQNSNEIRLLTALKCDVIQGFYFSEALPHDEFCRWMTRYRPK